MRIPGDAIISQEKVTRYLLLPRPWDDKSQFLGRAGFVVAEPNKLELAIRQMAEENEATDDGENEFGTFYRVVGTLNGPNGVALRVVQIWLQWKLDGTFHFVTLKPDRRQP